MRVVVVLLWQSCWWLLLLEVKRDMARATSSIPRIDPLAERRKWIEFASRRLNLCLEIQRTSDVPVTEKEFAEPKILALALLARTYMNLKGVIAVAKEGLVVEARTLTRACFENLFFVPNLIEKGDEFVTAMYDHERRSVRSQGEFLLEPRFWRPLTPPWPPRYGQALVRVHRHGACPERDGERGADGEEDEALERASARHAWRSIIASSRSRAE
jgi:hypothetical protein